MSMTEKVFKNWQIINNTVIDMHVDMYAYIQR